MDLINLKAYQLMLEKEKLLTISPDQKIALADLTMTRSSIGGLPVVKDGKVMGIVTQRDIMLARNFQIGGLKVEDLMTREIVVVRKDAPLKEILKLMIDHKIERIPVVDDDRNLLGLIVHGGILKVIYGMMG